MEKMSRYNMLPKTSKAGVEAGALAIVPPKYIKREVVKGALRPVGRFRGPIPMRTNASTLRLFGPGLSSFAAWQVRCTRMRCSYSAKNSTKHEKRAAHLLAFPHMPVTARQVFRPVTASAPAFVSLLPSRMGIHAHMHVHMCSSH